MRVEQARAALGGAEEVRRAAVAALESTPGESAAALALLVEALGDVSWRVRKEAAARAGGWPDRRAAAAALVEALGEAENVGRRNAAVEGLAVLGAEGEAPLVAALAARPAHRKLLVDTLGLIGGSTAAHAMAPLVDDPDPNVRVAAAEALGAVGGAEALAALRHALGRGEPVVQLAALAGLNRAGARLELAELEALGREPTLRAALFEALGLSGNAAAAVTLVAGLGDGARSVREAAARGLELLTRALDGERRAALAAQLGDGGAGALIAVLTDGGGGARAAASVLGRVRRADAVAPLVQALADVGLREAAGEALVAIGAPALAGLLSLLPDLDGTLRAEGYGLLSAIAGTAEHVEVSAHLGEALDDESPEAAAAAAEALGGVGGRAALAPLVRALEREPEVAQAAARALGGLGARYYDDVRILVASRGLHGPTGPYLCRVLGACGRDADVALLRTALGDDAAAVRRAAADALGQLGPAAAHPESEEALLFALADESAEVRAAAARALGAHARPHSVEPLARAARDPDAPVRAAAARALGQAAERADEPTRARTLEALRELADPEDALLAAPALEALGRAGDPVDEPRLIAALDAADAEVVKAAARALSGWRAGAAREALARTLHDRRWDVRRAAAQALGAHGPTAQALLQARRALEPDPLVREAIDAALARAAE